MGRKNIIPTFKIYDAVVLGSSRTSVAVNVQNLDKASIHLVWSAGSTPVGVFTVEARNGALDDWFTLDMGSTPISLSGNTGSILIRLDEMPFTDIRVVYTRTSGTATLTGRITAKQVGG